MQTTLKHLLLCIATLSLLGCASTPDDNRHTTATTAESDELPFDDRVSRLKLGMTKQQVISIMGDNYLPGGRNLSAQGSFEGMRYMPSFGSRYATALKRNYSFGIAGRRDTNGVMLQLRDGRLANISQF